MDNCKERKNWIKSKIAEIISKKYIFFLLSLDKLFLIFVNSISKKLWDLIFFFFSIKSFWYRYNINPAKNMPKNIRKVNINELSKEKKYIIKALSISLRPFHNNNWKGYIKFLLYENFMNKYN